MNGKRKSKVESKEGNKWEKPAMDRKGKAWRFGQRSL